MATTHSSSSRFVRPVHAVAVLACLAVFAILGLSQPSSSRTDAVIACEARRQAYERAIEKLSRFAATNDAGDGVVDQLIEARQKAYANYFDCLKQAGETGAVILSEPPPTWARPAITPPAQRTHPPFPPPMGTPRFTPGTPQGPPFTPPITRGRPPFTPPGPPMTPPGRSGATSQAILSDPPPTWARPPITPPAQRTHPPFPPPRRTPRFIPGTPQGPPFTPPGPTRTPPRGRVTPPGPPLTPPGRG